jgi:hypothetical protein
MKAMAAQAMAARKRFSKRDNILHLGRGLAGGLGCFRIQREMEIWPHLLDDAPAMVLMSSVSWV